MTSTSPPPVGNEAARQHAWDHGRYILIGQIAADSGTYSHAVGARIDSEGNLELQTFAITLENQAPPRLRGAGRAPVGEVTWTLMETHGVLRGKFCDKSKAQVSSLVAADARAARVDYGASEADEDGGEGEGEGEDEDQNENGGENESEDQNENGGENGGKDEGEDQNENGGEGCNVENGAELQNRI